MQKLRPYLILLFFLITAGTLQAQDAPTREVWLDKVISVMYAEANLTPEDKEWVKKILNATCDCKTVEEEEKGMECGRALLKQEGLPVEEADFTDMTPDQVRKLTLLAPLASSMLGECPE